MSSGNGSSPPTIKRKASGSLLSRKVQNWAKSYKDRPTQLIADGRMQAHGRRSIEASKASGLWNFMDDVDRLEVPSDLHETLQKNPNALPFFEALNASSKRYVLCWVKLAKTTSTRQKRVAELARLSAAGKKSSGT